MQYVNDDMDDMFRKAAEDYPLDTSGSDWNKVLAALQDEAETRPVVKRKDHRRFLWLLMLLPMGLVCNYYYSEGDQFSATSETKDPANSQNTVITKEKPGLPVRTGQLSQKTGLGESSDQKSLGGATTNDPVSFDSRQSKKIVGATGKSPITKAGNRQVSHGTTKADYTGDMSSIPSQDLNSRRNRTYTGFINPNKLDRNINIQPTTEFQPVSGQQKKTELVRNPKRFYLGLIGGIDKTTVEFQKKSSVGFDYGVLLGYQLGRKWSVEVAAFMDKKYYYTEGQYFKYDHIYLPPNTWITDIYGDCRMWDLSVGGTYSLGKSEKSGWFAAAGISSYLMKEENYDYTYYYGSTGVSKVHSKTYTNESKDLFSIVNLSLGYTHRLGKFVDLRVEPYVKMPLQGVGVGQLPLLSGGIHIGVTGKLF